MYWLYTSLARKFVWPVGTVVVVVVRWERAAEGARSDAELELQRARLPRRLLAEAFAMLRRPVGWNKQSLSVNFQP